jgi:hypothetical protein
VKQPATLPPDTRTTGQKIAGAVAGGVGRAANEALEAPSNAMDVAAGLATGTVAAAAGKVAGAVRGAYGSVTGEVDSGTKAQNLKDTISQMFTYQPRTESGKRALKMIGDTLSLPFVPSQKLGSYLRVKGYPNAAYVAEEAAEDVTMMAMPEIAKRTSEGIAYRPSEVQAELKIRNSVKQGVQKGIAPTVAKQLTSVQTEQYLSRATEAVKEIVSNKDNLKLTDSKGNVKIGQVPKTLDEFSQAVDQSKRSVFARYDAMKKAAGDKGATIDLSLAAKELQAFADDPVMQDFESVLVKKAKATATSLIERGVYTVDQAQRAIARANERLKAFYRNPTFETASEATLENIVANQMRKTLDASIEAEEGPGYQQFKNKYGALKAIEDDVAKRNAVDARKRPLGFFDISNIATGAEAAKALVTLSPANAAAAGAMYAVKSWIKWKNNPNTHINAMFSNVDRAMKDASR